MEGITRITNSSSKTRRFFCVLVMLIGLTLVGLGLILSFSSIHFADDGSGIIYLEDTFIVMPNPLFSLTLLLMIGGALTGSGYFLLMKQFTLRALIIFVLLVAVLGSLPRVFLRPSPTSPEAAHPSGG